MKEILYPKTYIVWDLETSGLAKEECKILEIGCMTVSDGQVVERKSWVLNHGIEIPEKITEITGITKELIDKEGQDPKKALNDFLEILLSNHEGAHVTHNGLRFDIEWLAYHVAKTNGWMVSQHRDLLDHLQRTAIDTAVFVKANKLSLPRLWDESFRDWADRVMRIIAKGVKYNVSLCCDEMGIDKTKVTAHRALGDVELTNEIYKKITA